MSQGATVLPTSGTISGLTEQNYINAALAALLSNNSGASAPGSVQGLVTYVTSTVDNFLTVSGRWGGGTGAVTGFSFAANTGNITSGRILVLGNP